MASRDSRPITFIIVVSLTILLVDARSWDLAVTIGKEVQFFANNGTSTGHVTNQDAIDLGGIAYDDSSRLLLLSDSRNTNATIFSKNLNIKKNFKMQTLHKHKNRTSIIGMVYDVKTQSLFWTDTKEQTIMSLRVSLNETTSYEPAIVLRLPNKLPRGISLDMCNRRLYWANSNSSNPSIESSNLDGSNLTTVLSQNLYEPLGVTVDHLTGKLYWIDDEEGVYYKIERSNLDGSERELITHGRNQQPYSIAVDREKIYWTDWTYSAIWNIKKNGYAGELPSILVSFHDVNRDADPKSIVTRDNVGNVNCAVMNSHKEVDVTSSSIHFPEHEHDNLITSTEDGDSIKEITFKCLNDGVHQPSIDKCRCRPGFDGPYCERSLCHNYCLHGECFVNFNGQPRCKCGPSYHGARCEQNTCSGYCLNDGYCSIKNNEPYCICKNSKGSRCEDTYDAEEICSIFCLSGLTSLNTIDTTFCKCANRTQSMEEVKDFVDKLWIRTIIVVLSTLVGLLTISVGVLSYYVNKLRRQPRIRKRIVVNKTSTPLTARPQLSSDQCEITIENCCNMNICETPCFEPNLRTAETHNHKKEEKNCLLDNMDGNSY